MNQINEYISLLKVINSYIHINNLYFSKTFFLNQEGDATNILINIKKMNNLIIRN